MDSSWSSTVNISQGETTQLNQGDVQAARPQLTLVAPVVELGPSPDSAREDVVYPMFAGTPFRMVDRDVFWQANKLYKDRGQRLGPAINHFYKFAGLHAENERIGLQGETYGELAYNGLRLSLKRNDADGIVFLVSIADPNDLEPPTHPDVDPDPKSPNAHGKPAPAKRQAGSRRKIGYFVQRGSAALRLINKYLLVPIPSAPILTHLPALLFQDVKFFISACWFTKNPNT